MTQRLSLRTSTTGPLQTISGAHSASIDFAQLVGMSQEDVRPAHLEPSQLGTRDYWDNYYQDDIDQVVADEEPVDVSELESWFDDVNAPAKVLEYLASADFPLSPVNGRGDCSILDLGMGNGGMLFSLRLEGGYRGRMVGVDYSQQSVDLARKLAAHYLQQVQSQDLKANTETAVADRNENSLCSANVSPVSFEQIDLIHDDPKTASWWPAQSGGFDVVLDKGTFDAISLSSDTVDSVGVTKRIHELYPRKVVDLVAPGGYFLLTSCNWTEEEVLRWFVHGDEIEGLLEVFAKIRYPVYSFGGQQGQGVVSVCFRKKS